MWTRWWGPQDKTDAALWCTTGAQQKERDETEQEGHWCTHPCTTASVFSFLAMTLHSFHNWKDIALEITCIFKFIHSIMLKYNDGGKHVPVDESLLAHFPLLSQLQTPVSWRMWTGSFFTRMWGHQAFLNNENGKGTSLYRITESQNGRDWKGHLWMV